MFVFFLFFMYVCMHVLTCVWMYVSECTWRPLVNIGDHLLIALLPYSLWKGLPLKPRAPPYDQSC